MKIRVSQDLIASAVRRDSHYCMIAAAIREATDAKYVLVDVQSIRWSNSKKGKRYTYMTPMAVQKAIIAFDRGDVVKPFSFSLQAPIATRKMMHTRTGDPAVVKRARAKYEQRAKKRGTRKSPHVGHATREREYGVRSMVA